MVRAIAPYMREQRSGVIANFSSVGAWIGGPGCAVYCASKWAISGISESLTGELKPFGISVISIEPGYFRSNLLNPGHRNRARNLIADYDGTTARQYMEQLDTFDNKQPGDIAKGCSVIIDVLTQTGATAGRPIPLRLVLGADANAMVGDKCKSTLSLLDEWKDVTTSTDHDDV
jgi:NAD(P)-dependent dehydrogenase (short-subunit alcohol dehydrogenase family)